MAFSQLDTYHATIAHEPHDETLFYAGFTADLAQRLVQHLGVRPGEIGPVLGMYQPVSVHPKPLDQPDAIEMERRFSSYYTNVKRTEGAYLDVKGVLHTPGSLYHFTHFVSPLREAETMAEMEAYKKANMITTVRTIVLALLISGTVLAILLIVPLIFLMFR